MCKHVCTLTVFVLFRSGETHCDHAGVCHLICYISPDSVLSEMCLCMIPQTEETHLHFLLIYSCRRRENKTRPLRSESQRWAWYLTITCVAALCLHFLVFLCNKRKLVNLTFVTTMLSTELSIERDSHTVFSCAAHRPSLTPQTFKSCLSRFCHITTTANFHFSNIPVLLSAWLCVMQQMIFLKKIQILQYISQCYYTEYTADVVSVEEPKNGRHLVFFFTTEA